MRAFLNQLRHWVALLAFIALIVLGLISTVAPMLRDDTAPRGEASAPIMPATRSAGVR